MEGSYILVFLRQPADGGAVEALADAGVAGPVLLAGDRALCGAAIIDCEVWFRRSQRRNPPKLGGVVLLTCAAFVMSKRGAFFD